MLHEAFGFSREHVLNALTIQQVKLYVHLADKAIERRAKVQAIEVAKILGLFK